jgi:L-ascorbate metabolism protein UlaG (beta-lactamase superfamily)
MVYKIICCSVVLLLVMNMNNAVTSGLTYDQIKTNLLQNPPHTGNPLIREESITALWDSLQLESAKTSQDLIDFYDFFMEKMKNELVNHPSWGTSVWQMYGDGLIIKTPQNVFAFDLVHDFINYDWDTWNTYLPSEIINQIQVLCISHMHLDHQDSEVADAVISNGGYVVVPAGDQTGWLYNGNVKLNVGQTVTLFGLNVTGHYALHEGTLAMQFEVLTQNNLKFLHTGDNQTAATLAQVNDLDVLMVNAWVDANGTNNSINGMRDCINQLTPTLTFPTHLMGVGYDSPNKEHFCQNAFDVDDVPVPSNVNILSMGERYFIHGPYQIFHKVFFLVNTCIFPDSTGPESVIQIRGNTPPMTWGADSQVFLRNVGGDYWTGEAMFPASSQIEYKFFTNTSHDVVYAGADWEHEGWEADLSTGNRLLTIRNEDITLPLQFVNAVENGIDQYFTPWEDEEGSFVVWIRVNMQGWEDFDPSNQVIGIRGANYVDNRPTGEISWNCTYPLNRESDHANPGSRQYPGGYLYSGPVHVPDAYAGAGIEFKVVVHHAGADLCESWDDMIYDPALQTRLDLSGNDTTNCWFWFDNLYPQEEVTEHSDEVIVTWMADMAEAIADNGFAHGEHLEVRSGYHGTANEVRAKTMSQQGFTTFYEATDTVVTTIGGHLDYQYYKTIGENDYREIYYNHEYSGDITAEAERRVQDPVSSSEITIEDIMFSETHIHRMPNFRNTDVIAGPVRVTFTCDLSPAVCFLEKNPGGVIDDIQTNVDIGDPDSVAILGVIMNGPATGGWGNEAGEWGSHLLEDETKKMYDDGTHGDMMSGDMVYSIQFSYHPDSNDVVGQEFKFGIGGGDNESGWGLNRIENIDDSQPTSTIACQFGSTNPLAFTPWNYDTQTCGVGEPENGDINGDGGINVIDIVILANHILNIAILEGDDLDRCDCNGDGIVNILDAVNIANVILGIIPECPGGGAKANVYPETIAFLKQLQSYLSLEELNRFMEMVKKVNVPKTFSLSQNYPNPFNPTTDIRYEIPDSRSPIHTTVTIHNILGQEVRTLVDEVKEPGYYSVQWDGTDEKGVMVSSGVYFYRLTTGDFSATKRMVLMK